VNGNQAQVIDVGSQERLQTKECREAIYESHGIPNKNINVPP